MQKSVLSEQGSVLLFLLPTILQDKCSACVVVGEARVTPRSGLRLCVVYLLLCPMTSHNPPLMGQDYCSRCPGNRDVKLDPLEQDDWISRGIT